MKTIIVALDFSDVSETVLREAASLAGLLDAELHLVHTVDPGPNYAAYGFSPAEFPVSPVTDMARESAEKRLAKLAETVALPPGKVKTATVTAMPVEGILSYAAANNANLIVVGAHGHGFLGSMLIGSVAQGIVRRAERPTLIIPSKKAG